MRKKPGFFFALALFLPASLCAFDDPFFDQRVRPVLTANCLPCHDAKTHASGFAISSLDSVAAGGSRHGAAVIPGDPAASPLVRILKGQLTPRMPLGKTLPDADLAIIETWIRNVKPSALPSGAAWLWPYRKPEPQQIPKVSRAGWTDNPIDAFVLQKLEEKKLAPAPPATKRTLARRLYFDLLGMPPTVEEMNAFLQDESPQAWAKLVDRLLDDPRYGERWGRHWLDLVRYGETSGLEGDGPIGTAWRYRDWVIDAFNRDLPYDQFVIQQLAGADEHSQTRNNYPRHPGPRARRFSAPRPLGSLQPGRRRRPPELSE